ncbi:GNAT family N-acetyltransferase [Cupriavidus pinatubonensis]|uniref:N-acetyltransferase domain-containing protein n=1 Tax=Cupriavidus pinatubonensis TaxID=248026 RepID=A0ABN7YWW7_9BURK|nr:GNAT family N-acetyltransferase [Cupriavidus pinatubonensis]CAG9177299.1 hypothetical protein LMG23994_03629 [Cupriavidus pinatubonensis]
MECRPLCIDDLELVCLHREAMFREAGRDAPTLAAMQGPFRDWLRPRLADGSYFGWVMEEGGAPLAGIGLMVIEWPPHPSHPLQDKRGYILNLYVDPSHRERGIGQALMNRAEAEFAERGIAFAVLHATEMGQPLYARMGWSPTTEMSKPIAG